MMATASIVRLHVLRHCTILTLDVDAIGPDMVTFGIESKYSSRGTSSGDFCQSLVAALHSLQHLCVSSEHSDFIQSARL